METRSQASEMLPCKRIAADDNVQYPLWLQEIGAVGLSSAGIGFVPHPVRAARPGDPPGRDGPQAPRVHRPGVLQGEALRGPPAVRRPLVVRALRSLTGMLRDPTGVLREGGWSLTLALHAFPR